MGMPLTPAYITHRGSVTGIQTKQSGEVSVQGWQIQGIPVAGGHDKLNRLKHDILLCSGGMQEGCWA